MDIKNYFKNSELADPNLAKFVTADVNVHTDIFLTNLAIQYKTRYDVGKFVAPDLKVNRPADKYLIYNKSSQRVWDASVKRREEPKEITVDTDSGTYRCEERELSKFVLDYDVENVDNPINLKSNAVKQLKEAMLRYREYKVEQIAGSSTLITNNTTSSLNWDVAASGKPVSDILTGIASVWNKGQEKANKIVMDYAAAIQAAKCDEYRDYFKYTQVTVKEQFDLVSGLRNLGLEPMIAGMFAVNTSMGAASDPTTEAMWAKKCLVFYSEESTSLEARTFMYSPFTLLNRVQVERKRNGEMHYIKDIITELLVDQSLAYLMTATIS